MTFVRMLSIEITELNGFYYFCVPFKVISKIHI